MESGSAGAVSPGGVPLYNAAMTSSIPPHLVAVALLLPAALVPWRDGARRDGLFWAALGVAAIAALGWATMLVEPSWSTGFATALWLTVAASLLAFVLFALLTTEGWRLAGLLLPYLVLLGLIAAIWSQAPEQPVPPGESPAWFGIHVLLGLGTYVLLTLAAVAGAGVVLQERALKRREPNRVSRTLPPLADSEAMEYRLLGASEVVLATGIVTGMGAQYALDGSLVELNHKTALTVAAFLVIGALLVARHLWGVRGRRAARVVLIGYLLLTLAYPGVKFVTDVLIG